jgi:hypothetical protein
VGEEVLLMLGDQEQQGKVVLATRNGVSLAVEFDGILGGYMNGVCLLWHDGGYHDLIADRIISVRRAA